MRLASRSLLAAVVLAAILGSAPARAEESVLEGLEREIRHVVETAGPAVAKVTFEQSAPPADDAPGGIRVGGTPGGFPFLVRTSRVGTGFLFSEDGIVLTSSRLAEGAETARVEFADGTAARGVVLGRDSFFPVAVIRIDKVPDAEPLVLVEGGPPAVGSLTLFVGHASGAVRNISLGIVTGVRRELPFASYDNHLVVNADLRPGDTGGPLLDRRGRVIGMGVGPQSTGFGILSGPGSAGIEIRGLPGTMGMGFAVPAEDLRYVTREIREHGRVRRGILGLAMRTRSLEVRQVNPDSPAGRAGFEPGDVIAAAGGKEVSGAADFGFRLRRTPVGTPFPVTVLRGGERVDLEPVLEELVPGLEPLFSGLSIQTSGGKVIVASVAGRLAEAGVRPGDVVLKVDGEEVPDGEALLHRLLNLEPDASLRLELSRGGDTVNVVVSN